MKTEIRLLMVAFFVSTASMKMVVFWNVALCSLVEIDRRFIGTYCHHYQGDNDGGIKGPLKRRPIFTRLYDATSQNEDSHL
jgi:hypothetical protein